MTRISDSTMDKLRVLAHELLNSRTDDEAHEAVRAFLTVCRREPVAVDENGDFIGSQA